jgi:insulysin
MTYIHPSSPTRSKLSVHSCSQKSSPPRVSLEASALLLKHFKAANVPVEEGPYNALAKLQLPSSSVQDTWRKYFEKDDPRFDPKLAQQLLELIPKLAKQHPVLEIENDGLTKPVHAPVYVDDIAALKARMTLGKAAIPVENWLDLSVSKL